MGLSITGRCTWFIRHISANTESVSGKMKDRSNITNVTWAHITADCFFTEIAHLTTVCEGDVLLGVLGYATKVHIQRLQLCSGNLRNLVRIYVSPGCFHLRIHPLPYQLSCLAPASQVYRPATFVSIPMCLKREREERTGIETSFDKKNTLWASTSRQAALTPGISLNFDQLCAIHGRYKPHLHECRAMW